jgi:hypothetical protein
MFGLLKALEIFLGQNLADMQAFANNGIETDANRKRAVDKYIDALRIVRLNM